MSFYDALVARKLTPRAPTERSDEEQRKDWHTALVAVQRLYRDQSQLAGERAERLAARYDQIIRLLLAESVNIRTPDEESDL